MMDMKQCFKCQQSKPAAEFYRHAAMADGRLNKCKECTIEAVQENRTRRLKYYREYDRKRTKHPDRKRTAAAALRNHRIRHPLKNRARQMVSNALRTGKLQRQPCERCGNRKVEAHHEDYSQPLNVQWLCHECHRIAEGRLIMIDGNQKLLGF